MEGDRFFSVLRCFGPDTVPCFRLTDCETVIQVHYGVQPDSHTARANKTQAGPGAVHGPAEIDQGPAKMATFHLAPSLTMWFLPYLVGRSIRTGPRHIRLSNWPSTRRIGNLKLSAP